MGLFGDKRPKKVLQARPFRMNWAHSRGGRYFDILLHQETGAFPSFGYFEETRAPQNGPAWLFNYAYELPYRGYRMLAYHQEDFSTTRRRSPGGSSSLETHSFRKWLIELWTPPTPTFSVLPSGTGRPYDGPTFMDRLLKTAPGLPVYYTGDFAFDSAYLTMTENPDLARDILTRDVMWWIGQNLRRNNPAPAPREITLRKHLGSVGGRGLGNTWKTVLVTEHNEDEFDREPDRLFQVADTMIDFLRRISPRIWPRVPGWPPGA